MIDIAEIEYNINIPEYLDLLKNLSIIDPQLITNKLFEEHLDKIKMNPNHKIFVAKIDNTIVGSITVIIEPKIIRNLSRVAHIEDVVVNPKFQGKGIGKILVNHAVEFARQNNCYKIILDCNEDKSEFYKKCGFEKKGISMGIYF